MGRKETLSPSGVRTRRTALDRPCTYGRVITGPREWSSAGIVAVPQLAVTVQEVFKHRKVEKDLSAVAVTGTVRIVLRSLKTSLQRNLLLLTIHHHTDSTKAGNHFNIDFLIVCL